MPYHYQRNKPNWQSQSFGFNPAQYAPNNQFRIKKASYNYDDDQDAKKKVQLIKNDQDAQTSFAGNMLGLDKESIAHIGDQGYGWDEGNMFTKKKDETNWWDKIGKQLGGDGFLGGVKGWLDLGVRGIEAYTGLEQVGLAREQNELGRDAFSFQKAAWNKDYDARKIAYNTNARDVNAWKAAQTPGGYVMSELVV